MNKGYKKLAFDTGAFLLSNIASKMIVYFLLPLYTKVLTAQEYGIADSITTTINLLYPILTLSITESVLRFTFEKKQERNVLLTHAILIIGLSSLFLILFSSSIRGTFLNSISEYWIEFIVTYILFNINNCFSYYVRAIGKTKVIAISGVIHTIVIVGLNLFFLLKLELGLEGYLWASIIGYVISILIYFYATDLKKVLFKIQINPVLLKESLSYSIPMIPATLVWWVNTSASKYIIELKLGVDARGLFAVAYKIPSLLTMFATVFIDAWRLSAYEESSVDDSEYYAPVYKYLNFFCVGLCAMLIVSTELIGKILFSDEFFVAWHSVPFLLLCFMFSSLCGFLASVFTKKKQTQKLLVSTFVGAGVNIALSFVLIEKYGIEMAAFVMSISFFIAWIFRVIQTNKICDLKLNYGQISVDYIILFIMATVMTLELNQRYMVCIIGILLLLIFHIQDLIRVVFFGTNLFKHIIGKR